MHDKALGKHFSAKDFILILVAVVLFTFAGIIHKKNPMPIIVSNKQNTALNVNKNLLLFFNLGNKRLISDLLWVQTLLESDEEHYGKNDLNSWMYLRFLSISLLDPLFFENYMYGGLYLSIVKDDVLGAAEIFEKGLIYYPDNYNLNYYAGFNYYFELGDFKKGLSYLEKIDGHPSAPPFMKLIIGKLKFETSQDSEVALMYLRNEYNLTREPSLKHKLKSDIYALQAQVDLSCLNTTNKNCSKLDTEGKPYINKSGIWKAQREFTPYRIHTPNRK
jgi:tetratricopeptide (TPR) repeat protein